MQRIANGTQSVTLPVAGPVVGTPGFATGGTPGLVPATTIDSDSWNGLQEELAHVIETSGITLSKTDNTQLLAALSRLFLGTPSLKKLAWYDPIVDYGCVGDGVTDDTANFSAFLTDCVVKKTPGRIPAARFKITGVGLGVDCVAAEKSGLTLIGAGRQLSIIDVSATTASPQFGLLNSGGGDFYVTMSDLGVVGYSTGTVFQVGKNDFSDAFNTAAFVRMNVNNTHPTAGAAVTLNYLIDSLVDIVANCSGPTSGAAFVWGRVQSCNFYGSAGNAAIGIHVSGTYSFSDTCNGMDFEVLGSVWQCDDPNSHSIVFIGGQFVWSQHLGVMNQASGDYIMIAPNLGSAMPDITGAMAQNVKILDTGFGSMTFGGVTLKPALPGIDSTLNLDAQVNQAAAIAMKRAGVTDWVLGMNSGGDMALTRFVGGTVQDTPFYVDNANGQTTITQLQAEKFGCYGIAAPATRPVVTGSRGGNPLLASLLTGLASTGSIDDQSSP